MRTAVCLNMIVKNEAAVIRRCLDSVRPFVDHWVIVDTGSTDGTQDIIRQYFAAAGVPGRLVERPWRNFGHNRSEALRLARSTADYTLVMDADNIFCAPADWSWPELTADGYYLVHRSGGVEYAQCLLVANRLAWHYEGVVHEYITSSEPHRLETLPAAWVDRRHEGARSRDPDTFRKDAAVLEAALHDEPGNARYAFYLGQSWRDAGEPAKALEAYRRRATMQGWDEETWYSLFQIAMLTERLGAAPAEVQAAYLAAFQFRPRRAEALVQLARWHRLRSEWALARLYADAARATPRPNDLLFVDDATYRYAAADEAAIAAQWIGDSEVNFALCWELLDGDRVPELERPRIESNRDFAAAAVGLRTGRYPAQTLERIAGIDRSASRGPGVTLTVACRGRASFERSVNSFFNCCRDITSIERFICCTAGMDPTERADLEGRYRCFEFISGHVEEDDSAGTLDRLLAEIATPFWLHLPEDWHFLVSTDYVARALTLLDLYEDVAQILFNRNFAETLGDRVVTGGELCRVPQSGLRYVIHRHMPEGPARDEYQRALPPGVVSTVGRPPFALAPSLLRTKALRQLGPIAGRGAHFERIIGDQFFALGMNCAFFDAVTCVDFGTPGASLADTGRASVRPTNAFWSWD